MSSSTLNLSETLKAMLGEVYLDRSISKTGMKVEVPSVADFENGLPEPKSTDARLKAAYNAVNKLMSTDANIAPGYALVLSPYENDEGITIYNIIDVAVARTAMWEVHEKLLSAITQAKAAGPNSRQLWSIWSKAEGALHTAMKKGIVGMIETWTKRLSIKGKSVKVHCTSTAALSKAAQGKGLMLAAYTHLITDLGFTLMSGDSQSPGGLKLWQALSKQPGVKVRAWKDGGWTREDGDTRAQTVDAKAAPKGGFTTEFGLTHASGSSLRLIATKA